MLLSSLSLGEVAEILPQFTMEMWASDEAITAEADFLANNLSAQMSQVQTPLFVFVILCNR